LHHIHSSIRPPTLSAFRRATSAARMVMAVKPTMTSRSTSRAALQGCPVPPDRLPRPIFRRARCKTSGTAQPRPRKFRIQKSLQIGKYLVTPLIKRLEDGRYAPSVSIRTGCGSATHDRVLRLTPFFDTPQAAMRHATNQGLAWVGTPPASPTPFRQEP